MKDLNVRPKTMKILEERTGRNVSDICCSNIFLHRSPEAMKIKAKIHYWDHIKITNFCTAMVTISKTKRQPTECEKIFANAKSDKG